MEKELYEFAREAGQWGLQLFGDALEKNNGDMKKALSEAKIRYYNESHPPMSSSELVMLQAEMAARGYDLDEKQQEEEMAIPSEKRFGPSVKHPRVKPSPFEKA